MTRRFPRLGPLTNWTPTTRKPRPLVRTVPRVPNQLMRSRRGLVHGICPAELGPPLSRFPCIVEALRTRNSCHRLYNCPRRTMDSFARRRVLHCRRLPRKSRRSLGRILWSPPKMAVVLRYKRLSPCSISSPRDKARRAKSYFEDEPDRRTDCGQHRETAGANCGRRAPQDGTQ